MTKVFSEQLRQAIRESGRTVYDIAAESQVDNGALSRFLAGKRGLSLAAIDKLVVVLDLELGHRKKRKEG